jgi:hypothetical protein
VCECLVLVPRLPAHPSQAVGLVGADLYAGTFGGANGFFDLKT